MVYSNGDKYDGQWERDKRNGRGVIYFADGKRYEGEWVDDKISDAGTSLNESRCLFP